MDKERVNTDRREMPYHLKLSYARMEWLGYCLNFKREIKPSRRSGTPSD